MLIRARAIETQCWFAAAADLGPTSRHRAPRYTYGHSLVCDPWGHVVAKVSDGIGWATARIDPALTARVRRDMPVLEHRRLAPADGGRARLDRRHVAGSTRELRQRCCREPSRCRRRARSPSSRRDPISPRSAANGWSAAMAGLRSRRPRWWSRSAATASCWRPCTRFSDATIPVFGMNCGSVGFLMNEFGEDDLPARIARAQAAVLHPLRMRP